MFTRKAFGTLDEAWISLRDFLGSDFDDTLTDPRICEARVLKEFAALGPAFYTQSTAYPYELVRFHFSGYKDGLLGMVDDFATTHNLSDLADVGCGVGLDAEALWTPQRCLTLYDYNSVARKFAKWRTQRTRQNCFNIRDLSDLGQTRHQLVYACDVIEHIEQPKLFLRRLFSSGHHVCFNLFEHDANPWDQIDMHFPLNHEAILPFCNTLGDLIQVGVTGATTSLLWRSRQ